jgi:uncharacterized repeat protein (TIGR03806 family)
MRITTYLLPILATLLIINACNKNDTPTYDNDLQIDFTQIPLPKLSDYHFFDQPLQNLQPIGRVLPYDLNTPLFSDYAHKARFVWMPQNTPIDYTDADIPQYPERTIFIKNFYYLADERNTESSKTIIETRLLVRRDTGWMAITYLWNNAQTDATLDVAGGFKPISWINSQGNTHSVNYYIPNKNDCKSCHNQADAIQPVGPNMRNLNKSFDYADGTQNQLTRWQNAGLIKNIPPNPQKLPDWDDPTSATLPERARAYLDVNCGNCHSPQGYANNSGLFLNLSEQNPTQYGVCKPPVAAGQGAGGLLYDIVPSNPDSSILIFRMESSQTDIRMPEIGRSLMHTEGVQLIRDWISSLPGFCG